MNTATTESIRLPEIIASMLNYAGVADTCEVTQGHAPVAIRNWAEMLQQLAAPAAVPVDDAEYGSEEWQAIRNGRALKLPPMPHEGALMPPLDNGDYQRGYDANDMCEYALDAIAATLATHPQPAAAKDVPELFVQWLEREMPAGTIIGKPAWWAPKLARALRSAERGVLGGCNG
jgi:hypothetical protein